MSQSEQAQRRQVIHEQLKVVAKKAHDAQTFEEVLSETDHELPPLERLLEDISNLIVKLEDNISNMQERMSVDQARQGSDQGPLQGVERDVIKQLTQAWQKTDKAKLEGLVKLITAPAGVELPQEVSTRIQDIAKGFETGIAYISDAPAHNPRDQLEL